MPLLAESSVVVAAKEPASAAAAAVETPKKLKPCCACPETKVLMEIQTAREMTTDRVSSGRRWRRLN